MKKKGWMVYAKIISFILFIFGFGSCDEAGPNGGFQDEYGCPYAIYKLNGKVMDAAQEEQPVRGIRVSFNPVDPAGEPYLWGDTVFTDKNGVFKMEHQNVPYKEWLVTFEDVDGEENGMYESKQQLIKVASEDYKGGGRWYSGEVDMEQGTVKLRPQEPDELENE
ncbi:MAG: radical SAM-associated putative lipoprotein [Tannerellaceae bacterium]|nr:radical SAM-associated putative lipoprotein [Tannerellaceae bacterium]